MIEKIVISLFLVYYYICALYNFFLIGAIILREALASILIYVYKHPTPEIDNHYIKFSIYSVLWFAFLTFIKSKIV